MNDHAQVARAHFEQGANCAQAVLLSFGDVTGFDADTALKLASSFGGGMGRLREVCGALTAIFMVAGMRWGYTDLADIDAKAAHYARIQALAKRFREENGTLLCRDLLALQEGASSPVPDARTPEYYQARPCSELVACAARLLDEMLNEEPYGQEVGCPTA